MEFDAEGNRGRVVHYIIDGKINGNTMTGTWTHDDEKGARHAAASGSRRPRHRDAGKALTSSWLQLTLFDAGR